MKLVPSNDPILKKVCEQVTDIKKQVTPEIVRQMRMIMLENNGCGLAAPQVGIGLAFFVTADGVYINPSWRALSQNMIAKMEGCLSFPKRQCIVVRYGEISAEWMNEHGFFRKAQMRGLEARIFQHETDHTQGKTIF